MYHVSNHQLTAEKQKPSGQSENSYRTQWLKICKMYDTENKEIMLMNKFIEYITTITKTHQNSIVSSWSEKVVK